ncbi:hypothetical protein EYF80_059584 [Liparis tanakae]|uniref:Uncharacterized protein n=1 Tax=Liparis tanakae TaxID=230148 RepID=A0A4Z2ENE2_9TELE|nr:hypothetical protein EYF80_059584 [Liparis tanakae]
MRCRGGSPCGTPGARRQLVLHAAVGSCSVLILYPGGSVLVLHPGGTVLILHPGGSVLVLHPGEASQPQSRPLGVFVPSSNQDPIETEGEMKNLR